MSKVLVDLDYFNEKVMEKYDCYNGIACPKCGKELFDVEIFDGNVVYPFMAEIACLNKSCKFRGTRYLL